VLVNSNGLTDFARINLLQNSIITKCSNKLGHLILQICKKVSVALQCHVTCEAQLQKGDLTPNILSRIEATGLPVETASVRVFPCSICPMVDKQFAQAGVNWCIVPFLHWGVNVYPMGAQWQRHDDQVGSKDSLTWDPCKLLCLELCSHTPPSRNSDSQIRASCTNYQLMYTLLLERLGDKPVFKGEEMS
jgi:hypothetical protein